MDMKLNSMNNVYHKTSSSFKNVGSKFNVGETKNTTLISEQKSNKSDKVSISHEATKKYEVQKMTKKVMNEIKSTDREEKIKHIKAKIENNTYEVSSDKIAGSILSRLV